MQSIDIDIETYSPVDLAKSGVYRYAEAAEFEILLFGYSVDGSPVCVIDLASGEMIPKEILDVLTDDSVIKWAMNANFERVCLSRYLSDAGLLASRFLNPVSWRCSMVWSAYLGLPLSLADVGAALGLEKQKLTEGKELIRYFCKPCEPTTANAGRTRNRPSDAPEKWELFKAYNLRDVETEMEIQEKLRGYPVPDDVWEQYHIDQEINDRGIAVDMALVQSAIDMDGQARAELTEKMQQLTRLDNPNSVQQMKQWLANNGMEIESLGKKQVIELLKDAPPLLRDVLLLRQQLAKSSVKKYFAMKNAVCADGRVRGMFQFYGANRTGRFSSKIVQMQNLAQNHLPDLASARCLVRNSDYVSVEMLYGSVPDTLSELIRTAFIPSPGKKLIVADFSAIEARVIAWLAGEEWRMELFRQGGDIYCQSASQMFKVPVIKHGVNGHLRQKGKIAELACGYGGSVGALKAMGALDMGLKEEELYPLVQAWRASNPNIVKLWWDVDSAVMTAVREKTSVRTHGLTFCFRSGMLFITLPSGRQLAYVKPRIGENQFGSPAVTYMGTGSTKKWERIESYGPKFVENCIAEGTLVITDHGCIPIETVQPHMRIWDGTAFVFHGGVTRRWAQQTVSVNGIHMTPDHKILTTKGWEKCGRTSIGSYWAEVSLPDGFVPGGEHPQRQSSMAVQMRLRQNKSHTISKPAEERESCQIMRLYENDADCQSSPNSWYVSSPCMGSLAFNEAKMLRSESSRLSQLRRPGHYCLRPVGGELRRVLGRYGANMGKGIGPRSYRQQSRIQPRKLQMDNAERELPQQTEHENHQDTVVGASAIGCIGVNRNWRDNAPVSSGSQLADRVLVHPTGMEEAVYDILNCGPRHRFAIWDGRKARIVSNCVQGISRDILCHAMKTLRHCAIVAHVHDELIIEADPGMSVNAVCEQMARTPPWAVGLPLRADGYECEFYQKD